jgi:uncharacterized protein (DUF2336 family)
MRCSYLNEAEYSRFQPFRKGRKAVRANPSFRFGAYILPIPACSGILRFGPWTEMTAARSLIPEIEDALQRGDAQKRGETLRRITSLFLDGSTVFNDEQVKLFDDVLLRLIAEIETKARAELSRRLAPLGNAPHNVMRRLASDDEISVAGPVLMQSPRLDAADLAQIASSKSQAHLFAISYRKDLDEAVTDLLVDRGNEDVVLNVAGNVTARFSDSGYSKLVDRAVSDGALAEAVAKRPDIPDRLFRELLVRATAVVQRRLLASARPETQAEIRHVMARVSDEVASQAQPLRNYKAAIDKVRALNSEGLLDESQLVEFARTKAYDETVAALSEVTEVPVDIVDRLMGGDRPDPVLILCKAAGYSWPTAKNVILLRLGSRGKSTPTLDAAAVNFDKLSMSTAQRVVRFWQNGQGQIQ